MDAEMIARAKEVDEILGIDAQGPKQQQQQQSSKKNKNKRALEAGTNARPNATNNNKKQKPQVQPELASRSEFDGLGQLALAV